MDEKKILQHLLDLEKQAAALVTDAQEEAEQKMSEGEKESRARSEELCAREHEALEKVYIANNTALKENYRKQLDGYREESIYKVNREAFFSLAGKYLIGTDPHNRET